jgi:hypothetical protein
MMVMTRASSAAEGRSDTPGIAGCRKILTVKPRQTILSPVTVTGNRALTCNNWWAILGLNQ